MTQRQVIGWLVVLLMFLAMLPLLGSIWWRLTGTSPEERQAVRGVEEMWGLEALAQGWGVVWLVIVALLLLLVFVFVKTRPART